MSLILKIFSALLIGIAAVIVYILRNVFNYSDNELTPIIKAILIISIVVVTFLILYFKSKIASILSLLIEKITGKS